jgi:hypothetical protein
MTMFLINHLSFTPTTSFNVVDEEVSMPKFIVEEWLSFSATCAATQAHSSVHLVRGFFLKLMNSQEGGLTGGNSGGEGMFSDELWYEGQ